MTIAESPEANTSSGAIHRDYSLLAAIEVLAGIPGLADHLHGALKGEPEQLFQGRSARDWFVQGSRSKIRNVYSG